MATSYMNVDGKSVFIVHNSPYNENQLHKISILPSGDFEVVCTHNCLDTGRIKSQIKYLLKRQLIEKKNQ